MAIDMAKLSYHLYLLRESGESLDITEIVTNAEWEENKGELASRMSLTVANVPYNGTYMSSIAKPNCYVLVYAELGGVPEEVARCKITEWDTTRAEDEDALILSGYDELFDLQKSEDHRFIKDGTSTKKALTDLFSDWGIPLGKYDGPTAACAKTPYSDPLSDIILDLLDNAHKHGDPECHVRANKGKVDVIQKGSNSTVYCFEEGKNLSTARMKISTSDMITVVKILSAEEDDDGKRAVESLVEGKTEYGRRQKILIRDADDDLATATSSANQILKDEGEPEKTLKVKTPDVPFIRKYDRVQITSRTYTGAALVLSIQHDIDSKSMTMELEPTDESAEAKAEEKEKSDGSFKKGDLVNFAGGYHYYTSTDKNPRGGYRKGGKAWVQNVAPKAPHPYALIGGAYKSDVPGDSNVYGWVDADTVS
ncbi:MAG: hypothetical protein IJT94_12690 [Oscillibacter sp.]|nr:hypothetical protein [Oscillibacter sp.]